MCSQHQDNVPYIYGMHHDFNGELEKNGHMRVFNKVLGKHGVYKADIEIDGKYKIGTNFFPQEWSPEKVVDKVMEAYDNFIGGLFRPFVDSLSNCRFIGYTTEGIPIHFLISLDNEIQIAYPIVDVFNRISGALE